MDWKEITFYELEIINRVCALFNTLFPFRKKKYTKYQQITYPASYPAFVKDYFCINGLRMHNFRQ